MDYKNETEKTLSTNTPEDNQHQKIAKEGMDAALEILGRYEIEDKIEEAENLPEDTVKTDLSEEDSESEPDVEEVFEDIENQDEDLDGIDDDVKVFEGGSSSVENDDATDKTRTFENPNAKKQQTEIGFSFFEDEDEEELAEDEILEPEDSLDGDEIYEVPNTADDAEPYYDTGDDEEYEIGEVTEEAEYEEETDEDYSDSDEEYIQETKVEKEDALKRLFYGAAEETVKSAENGKKKERKKKEKKVKEPQEEVWDKNLGIAKEIDMADHKAVSAFAKKLEKKKANCMIALACVVICFVVSMYLELAPVSGILPYPAKLLRTNPAIYVLVDLQMLFFGVMFMFDSLVKGVETWLDHRIVTPAGTAVTVTAFSAIQGIVTAFVSGSSGSLRIFCSLGCASLVMLSLYEVLLASSTLRSFRIASLSSTKFGASKLSSDSRELAAIENGKNMDGAMAVDICKSKIYKNFVKRMSRLPECEKKLWIPTAVVFAASIVVGFISAVGTKSVYQGLSNAALVYLSSVPLNIFICSALPEYVAIKRGREINATMVGHNAGSEFKKLSAVTFADTTVFLPKDTRLESQIIVDTERFCDVTLTMVKIFRHIGGPLRYVFDRNLPNPDQEIPAQVELTNVSQNYIEVNVDGKNYVVATEKHLTSMGLKFTRHDRDERYSILFLIDDGKVLAKFRIIYKVDSRFENTSRELDDVHISIGIKTVTPGINEAFLRSLDEFRYCDFTVIRGMGEADLPNVSPETDSGVVALGSVHKFLEMLLLCEISVRRIWINSLLKYISAGFCVLASAWLILFSHSASLDVVFGLIIQMFWLLPVTLNSYMKK